MIIHRNLASEAGRRLLLGLCSILAMIDLTCSVVSAEPLTALVDPFIGTGGHGHTFPGATAPFGMVQLSPDTGIEGWDWCSGYHDSDRSLLGFSHTHLSGTGAIDYGDILFVPSTGTIQFDPGTKENPDSGYRSRFRHSTETATPGYYAVHLDDTDIDVELTASPRVGFHRYTFGPSSDGRSRNVLIDLLHGLGPDRVTGAQIRIIGDRRIHGLRRSSAWAGDQWVYFSAEFSAPFVDCGIAIDGEVQPGLRSAETGQTSSFAGEAHTSTNEVAVIKAFARFSPSIPILDVKVALSAVSIEGARNNLESEIHGWDFDQVRQNTEDSWESYLSRIRVQGGSRPQQRTFYTALYHSLLAPNLYMDVDRKYRGTDQQIHVATDFDNYTVFSLWDTFRATHPLYNLIAPEKNRDFVRSLLERYREGGLLPVWELAANETGTMIGYHSVPVILDAYVKGVREFDVDLAFEAMIASASSDVEGLDLYREVGFVPSDRETESVSKTLEYAYDDWCIARLAEELGRTEEYETFNRRAQFYRNVYDPESGFMRGRTTGGKWKEPFDPRFAVQRNSEFTEGNSWQYTWFVPHHVEGLIELMGGEDVFTRKLDELFEQETVQGPHTTPDVTGLIGQYAHGNEPSHHAAYLYAYAGAPWKTQDRVRDIMETLYSDQRDGLCGNEDCGQMSSWFVMSALGLYPVCPGQDQYVFGSPLFEEVTLSVPETDGPATHGWGRPGSAQLDGTSPNSRTLTIRAPRTSSGNRFVQSVHLGGAPHPKSFVRHGDLWNAGRLEFEMSATPNTNFGRNRRSRPHSESLAFVLDPPMFESESSHFVDQLGVALARPTPQSTVLYTLDGLEPTRRNGLVYAQPIRIDASTTVRAIAIAPHLPESYSVRRFFQQTPFREVAFLRHPYSDLYTGGGPAGLVDGLRGSSNYHDGRWQGFERDDLDVVIDLGEARRITSIKASFLQSIGSWIFMPVAVEFALSNDGSNFEVLAVRGHDVPQEQGGDILEEISIGVDSSVARYVRTRATNVGTCPPWHRGAGGKAWIFIDEIEIEHE